MKFYCIYCKHTFEGLQNFALHTCDGHSPEYYKEWMVQSKQQIPELSDDANSPILERIATALEKIAICLDVKRDVDKVAMDAYRQGYKVGKGDGSKR